MGDKLEKLFNPKSIAIIGASNNPKKIGNILINKLKNFKGELIPINLKEEKILGFKTYKSVLEYKKQIDLAVIATPKETIKKILQNIEKKQIKNLIIITSGFSEIKDYKSENYLKKFIEKNQINLLGPNCLGIINSKNNLDISFSKYTPKTGDTVFISQSGALGSYIMDLEIPLRAFVSLGNMTGLTFNDFIEYFNDDPLTKKIILYIEKIKDGKKFIEICKKSNKEIIAIKSGRTKEGQKSTNSHTGSLSTSREIYKGAFKQSNIKQYNSLTEAFGLKKEDITESIKGKKIAIITNAGGAGALLTDELIEKKYKIFGPKDLLGTATSKDYYRALHRITQEYDRIIVIFTPQMMSEPIETAKEIILSRYKHKIIALFLGKKSLQESIKLLEDYNIPVYTQAI